MWLWHLPGPYDLALERGVVHALEHATFLGTAVLFWVPVLDPAPRLRPPLGAPGRAVYLVLAAFQASALGLLLAAWPAPLYSAYAAAPGALDDQAWAGALMWAVTAAADMAAVLVTVCRAMGAAASRPPGPISDPVRVRAAAGDDATARARPRRG
jgi:putative membrane protein